MGHAQSRAHLSFNKNDSEYKGMRVNTFVDKFGSRALVATVAGAGAKQNNCEEA